MKLTDEIKKNIDEFFDNKTEAELQYIADKYQALQLHKTQVSGSVLDKEKTIDEKIVAFVKAKLNTFKIVENMIYVDKYKVYYNGGYVGNIKHLYDTFI